MQLSSVYGNVRITTATMMKHKQKFQEVKATQDITKFMKSINTKVEEMQDINGVD